MDKETVAHIIHNGILLGCKKGELIQLAAVWVDPENVMLSEIHQTDGLRMVSRV